LLFSLKTGEHTGAVCAEDALIAALKVKMQHPEALIAYVRQQNKRGGLHSTQRYMNRLNLPARQSQSSQRTVY
jgi:hypothetical protein